MKIVREHIILEKFTEDGSDPIADMNIGMIHQIKLWMTSIDELFEDKDQALVICAERGKIDYVKYLLSAGADIHVDNDRALQWASENGHIEVVKVLLNASADVHANDDFALHLASNNGHAELVKVLLSAGANVHARNDNALQLACINGYVEVVKVLLSAGVDVHARNDNALRYASRYGHTDVVKVLKDWIAKEKKTKKTKVRESLNEKFTEDSDPIDDMGIGITRHINDNLFKNIKKAALNHKFYYFAMSGRLKANVPDALRYVNICYAFSSKEAIIQFYYWLEEYYDSSNNNKINKIDFTKYLLKEAGILECIKKIKAKNSRGGNTDPYTCTYAWAYVKDKYYDDFKKIKDLKF